MVGQCQTSLGLRLRWGIFINSQHQSEGEDSALDGWTAKTAGTCLTHQAEGGLSHGHDSASSVLVQISVDVKQHTHDSNAQHENAPKKLGFAPEMLGRGEANVKDAGLLTS